MKRNEEKYHKTKIDIICDLLVKVVLPCIVIGIMLLITFTSHASGTENTAYFPMYQNANNAFPEVVKTAIDSRFDNENNFIFFYTNDINNDGWTRGWVGVISKNGLDAPYFYGEIQNNGYAWNAYALNNITIACYKVNANRTTGLLGVTSLGNNQAVFNNMVSNIYSSNYDYISNFKIYTSNNENRSVVLKYGSDDIVIDTGHATPPADFNTPVYPQGHAKPQTVPPTYTVNNYSWTTYTPPVVDNSTLEKLVESLTDIVKYNATYLKDNLHNEFTSLIDNIKGLIEYIGETIQYYGDLIIDNIQNLITTFYNNMVSIGEDITDKLTYIVSPLDTTALQTAVENTGIYNDYDRMFDMIEDAFGFYNDIQEPNTFTIPIDLRNVTILHQTQIVYIDLGWLNSCKTIIRAFMWCVLTFGLLYTIIDSIPDYLHGNDE